MVNPSSEEEKIVIDLRNLFRIKKSKMTLQLKIYKIFLD